MIMDGRSLDSVFFDNELSPQQAAGYYVDFTALRR